MQFITTILQPLEWLIAQLLILGHTLLVVLGMPDGPGLAWCLSIMGLVLVIRLCLLPLFMRQMTSMRRVQAIQPQLQRIQRKYASRKDPRSQEAMQRETMELYRKEGANPMGSCLPALVQMPVLCSLFYTLQRLPMIANGSSTAVGGLDRVVAGDIESSRFLGVRVADTFMTAGGTGERIVIGAIVAVMCVTLLVMQWLLTHRNTSREVLASPQFRMQRMTVFVFPLLYVFSGFTLPFGVLIYWVTNNLWNLGQTLVQLHWFPAPGSIAGERKELRDRDRENRRRAAAGLPSLEEQAAEELRRAATARRSRESRRGRRRRVPGDLD
ncbi:membrane protein insertase YidC [Bifidobacterium callimiconis]|uniref:Membrane protein insertase YidC n=1 Tax=Bifidobacterium callimiconis TaxID=2306973 RepID=A0A430FF35_9BIFI|nr:membrane protein insertase YidC [Bifidobacterium callimiconis]RSX51459.1 Membrane invertase YidC [Bifidobacterium callimiconis]